MRLTEEEILEKLKTQMSLFEPLEFTKVYREANQVDAIVDFSIKNGSDFKAAVELVSISTPKAILQKCNMLKSYLGFQNERLIPMIVAPYIGETQASFLKQENISWIDLSGNMVLSIPPNIYIERRGKTNKYPDTVPIKKVFQGTSSLVSRALLLKPEGFSSLYEIVDFINGRNGQITIATVSKVLKSLEEKLLIRRKPSRISVKEPEQILERLAEGYADYFNRRSEPSYKYDFENIAELCTALYDADIEYAFSGFYAANLKGYATTEQITILLRSVEDLRKVAEYLSTTIIPDEEYGNVKVIETKNSVVWFNLQEERLKRMVDDIELYLEMIIDRPRGPKIAKQLKNKILEGFNG